MLNVMNRLSIFLDRNPNYKVVSSFCSGNLMEVIDFRDEPRLPTQMALLGRDRFGRHACWIVCDKTIKQEDICWR